MGHLILRNNLTHKPCSELPQINPNAPPPPHHWNKFKTSCAYSALYGKTKFTT